MFAIINKADEVNPCAIIIAMAAIRPHWVLEQAPAIIKPIWPIEE